MRHPGQGQGHPRPNACDWEESDLFDLIKEIISGLERGREAA